MSETSEFYRIQKLPPYVFAVINEMKAKARAAQMDVVDLGMGNPDGATPQIVVDKLIEAARNPRILRDGPGYIEASKYVVPIEVPTRIDRALGDLHPMGNPHINLDPVLAKDMARAIADGLAANYPEHEAEFQKNLTTYLATLDQDIARWEREAAPLKGKKFVSYHPDFNYFAERFGMEMAGTIEIRPGVDPTPSHVTELEEQMRKEKVDVVIREVSYPAALAETVAQATGAKLVELPTMVGGVPEAKDYASFIEYTIRTLLKATGSAPG